MGSVRERCQGVSDSVCVYPSTVRAPYSVDQTNQINLPMAASGPRFSSSSAVLARDGQAPLQQAPLASVVRRDLCSMVRYPCSVPTEPADLSSAAFDRNYREQMPVVIVNATVRSGAHFRALTTLEALTEQYGHLEVTLSSANTHSYGRRRALLSEYIQSMQGLEWSETGADDLYYFFGEHGSELQPLLSQYKLPRLASSHSLAAVGARGAASTHEPALSFGVAADGSGVPFHFHNDGFSEVQHGAKRWLLYPSKPPHYDVNATSTQWLERVYPKLTRRERPYDCTIEPGDLLYFPSNWYHAIVNQGVTVFMSTFL